MNAHGHPARSTVPDGQDSVDCPKLGENQQIRTHPLWLRALPLVALVGVIGIAFVLDVDSYLRFETLRSHRNDLATWVENAGLLAPFTYLAVYVGVVLLSLPGPIFVTLAGGFLFGAFPGALLSLTGATIGATIVFLVVRNAVGNFLVRRGGKFLQKMEAGFQKNAFSYLLTMRLVPLFPFGMVNLAAGILGVRVKIFLVATLLGSFPAALILSLAGAELDDLLQSEDGFSLKSIMTPRVVAALIGLVGLALAPIVYKLIRKANVRQEN
ncbi:MAG TPA: TVP38/TMEM64 family protein [Alphaproteobacteria bacterium]|nr:TVP38/TMEM64 family protein [Alphaproteobacteria bacterium]